MKITINQVFAVLLVLAIFSVVLIIGAVVYGAIKYFTKDFIVIDQPKWVKYRHIRYTIDEAIVAAIAFRGYTRNDFILDRTQLRYVDNVTVIVYLYCYELSPLAVTFDIHKGYTLSVRTINVLNQ